MNNIVINCPILGRDEIAAVTDILRKGSLTSAANKGGVHVQRFEQSAASFVGSKYAVAVNSGTAALQAALYALDIKSGDEILVPSFTFVATANAVISVGARPIFVDITRSNYTMDIVDLERKITKKTRAIIPVHLYGHVADIDGISEISNKYNIPVIEDAAQSLGSTYKRKQTGRFFEMGCFSMYPGKVLTAGEGGFITTDKKQLRDKLLMIRNHGMLKGYDTQILGMNMRLPEISAAIAEIQVKRLPAFLSSRRQNAKILSELLAKTNLILPNPRKHEKVNWSLYTVASEKRDILQKALCKKHRHKTKQNYSNINTSKTTHLSTTSKSAQNKTLSIGAMIYYPTPVHKMPFYQSMKHTSAKAKTLINTDWAASVVLSLPVHPKVTKSQIKSMAEIIKQNL